MRTIKLILLLIGAMVLGAGAATVALEGSNSKFAFLFDDFTIDTCLEKLSMQIAPPEDYTKLRDAGNYCYNKLVDQGKINEFQMRRYGFRQQHVATTAITVLVMALTIAGVTLASFQIFNSARIYKEGQLKAPEASEISIEHGKIYMKSSITGLFILLISLVFFYIYIIKVYTITELPTLDNQEQATVPTPMLPGEVLLNDPGGQLEIDGEQSN